MGQPVLDANLAYHGPKQCTQVYFGFSIELLVCSEACKISQRSKLIHERFMKNKL